MYSYLRSLKKAGKIAGFFVIGAVATALASPDFSQSMANHPGLVIFIPAVQALAVFSLDWLKHHKLDSF